MNRVKHFISNMGFIGTLVAGFLILMFPKMIFAEIQKGNFTNIIIPLFVGLFFSYLIRNFLVNYCYIIQFSMKAVVLAFVIIVPLTQILKIQILPDPKPLWLDIILHSTGGVFFGYWFFVLSDKRVYLDD